MTSGGDTLEETLKAEMRKAYSETVVDHAVNPRNVGDMADADGCARITGPCGDTMEIWLKVSHNTIMRATFLTDGCGTTIAAGSMITDMVRGKGVSQALRISQQDILDALSGLPEESQHCALLAANTLKAAIKDYLVFQKEPWKRAYKKH